VAIHPAKSRGIRVALARAVYARTKYVLLDDPLSAVVSIPRIGHLFVLTRAPTIG
jgi:ABC-type uncharacterized transport system YnjBCD ATPase subunit